jgi:ADP-ribose pyrophosphatase YjhB (NUDIX family)
LDGGRLFFIHKQLRVKITLIPHDAQNLLRILKMFKFCPYCSKALLPPQEDHFPHQFCPNCHTTLYRNPVVGVAVILMQADKILLVQRAGSYAGLWCIPCGYVEWDEDVRQAAAREMNEETGLEVEIGPVFRVHSNFHDPQRQTVGIWFWGKPIGGSLKPGSDAKEARFFSLDEVPENIAFPTDRLVLEELRSNIQCALPGE